MEERAKQIAELLKVLANENRLLILCALMNGAKNVSELTKFVPNITPSALSQHLALLKAHKILDSQKCGLNVAYSIFDDRIKELFLVLKKHYCSDQTVF